MEALLEVQELVAEFRTEGVSLKAVDGISFALNKGETVGMVGESGSGKSVTALSLMRLLPCPPGVISKGELHYHSRTLGTVDLLKLPETAMRALRGNEIAMIFQEPMTSLNPVYSCGRQVSEAILLHQKVGWKEAREKTLELFADVQLPRPEVLFDTYPHQISGGQKQRVMIAMAMSCRPDILIADEPTTALDVTVQRTILDLMKSLQERYRMALLFITHDLDVIGEVADRVLVMHRGRIVEQGSTAEILHNPRHPYTRGLLACRPPLHRRLRRLPIESDFCSQGVNDSAAEGLQRIEQVLGGLSVAPGERAARQSELYARRPILSVRNLKAHFPITKGLFGRGRDVVKAVDDVTFDVFPGETLGLVGESGCGKTTLGRTIIRLVEPTGGAIIFKDRCVSDLAAKELRSIRKAIQMVFQDPYSSLNPRKRIGDAIMEPMRVHGIGAGDSDRRDTVMGLLQRVSLEASHFYRYPHEFSDGQRQRICIARALSLNPECLICDESVSSLDTPIQAQVLNLLAGLRREFGFTCIFISHDLSVVKFMSDRMVVMNRGRIEEMGDADEIYSDPKTDYTRRLVGAIPGGRLRRV